MEDKDLLDASTKYTIHQKAALIVFGVVSVAGLSGVGLLFWHQMYKLPESTIAALETTYGLLGILIFFVITWIVFTQPRKN